MKSIKVTIVLFAVLLGGCTTIGPSRGSSVLNPSKQNEPPRSQLGNFMFPMAVLTGISDVYLDWSRIELSSGNGKGIKCYRIYRDKKIMPSFGPIRYGEDDGRRRFFLAEVPAGTLSWTDTTGKDRRSTYYYVVTAVNVDDEMEQGFPSDLKFQAVININ